jgi:hypothetical protein
MALRDRFLKVYDNIPLKLRDQVCVVFDGKPLTWNVVYLEVKNKTKDMEKILEKMGTLGLI